MRIKFILFFFIFIFACTPKALKKSKVAKSPSKTNLVLDGYVLKENVRLRSEASTKAQVVTTLEDGDALQLLTNQHGWYGVITDNGKRGWIRSNLVGPRSLSRTRLAACFVDSVLPAFKAQLFFDKQDLYKTLYLTLPAFYYVSKKKSRNLAKEIGLAYQRKVYPGKVEIRVLKPNSKQLYFKLKLAGRGLVRVPVPFLKCGRLVKFEKRGKQVKIYIIVSDSLNRTILLKTARSISAQYDYPFTKAEIYMISDNPAGLQFIKHFDKIPQDQSVCRLYYIEDKNGEDYRFDFCRKRERSRGK